LVWYAKSKGTKSEKLYEKIMILLKNLKNSLKIKNEKISNKAIKTEKNVKTIVFKNKGKIQWMVENNLGEKDKYWTMWYLAAKVCMYMCIYVYMYVDKCIYIYIYMCVCIYIHICKHVLIYMTILTCVYDYIHTYIYGRVSGC
jgi:hypothetical protein